MYVCVLRCACGDEECPYAFAGAVAGQVHALSYIILEPLLI